MLQKEKGVREQFQNSCPADVPVVRSAATPPPPEVDTEGRTVSTSHRSGSEAYRHCFILRRGGIPDENSDLSERRRRR